MKHRKLFRTFIVMIAALMMLGGFSVTAHAGGGEETPPETTEPESTPPPNPITLTPDGNLTLVDDIQGEQAEDKQFITVVTKNGNYFYIIIDRAGDTENVYFLNMVDEADLLALIEDMDTVPPPTVTPQPEPQPTPDPEPTEPEQPEKKSNIGSILLMLLVIAGAGGGAFYYFKVVKPKQGTKGGTDLAELDELDFDDEDDYINMDETSGEE